LKNSTLHIGDFRKAHQELVLEVYAKDGADGLAMYCACMLCPVLAAYSFCLEKYPEDELLTKRIEGVKLFYGVSKIEE
jgi:hypothetical protein